MTGGEVLRFLGLNKDVFGKVAQPRGSRTRQGVCVLTESLKAPRQIQKIVTRGPRRLGTSTITADQSDALSLARET